MNNFTTNYSQNNLLYQNSKEILFSISESEYNTKVKQQNNYNSV